MSKRIFLSTVLPLLCATPGLARAQSLTDSTDELEDTHCQTLPAPYKSTLTTTSTTPRGRRVVFLSFDEIEIVGGQETNTEDSKTNTSYMFSSQRTIRVPRWEPSGVPELDVNNEPTAIGTLNRDEAIQYIVTNLEAKFSPYDIEFTTTRPASGDYTMVVFGSSCEEVGNTTCGGLAMMDCGDNYKNNIVWSFNGRFLFRTMVNAAHEIGHSLGLMHINDPEAIMFPSSTYTIFPNGAGVPNLPNRQFSAGNVVGSNTCSIPSNLQDSNEVLAEYVGVEGQDVTPPTLEVTIEDNDVLRPGDSIDVVVDDESGIKELRFSVGETVVETLNTAPWTIVVPADLDGLQTFIITATDMHGNYTEVRHNIQVTMPTQELGESCDTSAECFSDICHTSDSESFCVESCDADNPCPDDYSCSDEQVCLPIPEEDDNGGSSGGSSGGDSGGSSGDDTESPSDDESGGCNTSSSPLNPFGFSLPGLLLLLAVGRPRKRHNN